MQTSEDDIRLALAARAYAAGVVRLADPNLAGATHLVATRRGLFAADRRGARLVAHGMFYGLTLAGAWAGADILAFEACDLPRRPSGRGRIVRFRRKGTRIAGATVVATGLGNGCHQLDLVDGWPCLIDTYAQRVLRFFSVPAKDEWGTPELLHPLPSAATNDWAGGYAHVNSLLAYGDATLLMLHNGGERTGRPSEIAWLDRDWRLIERRLIAGFGCHDLAVLADGRVLACDSLACGLIASDGWTLPVTGASMMTRGLSVGADGVAVGGSGFADRGVRDDAPGAVFFLDSDWRSAGRVDLPGPVTAIRRLDGQDRGLSGYLSALSEA